MERPEGKRVRQGANEEPPRKEEKYYRLLIENALDVITTLDREGRVIYNSPSLKRVLGYEQNELNGKVVFELVHPDDRQGLLEVFGRGIQTAGATEHVEYRFLHADGSWRFFESVANNLLDDPAVNAIVVNSRDITDRKLLEERLRKSEEYFRAVVENTVDVITIVDASGNIIYMNRAVEKLLGYDPSELQGRNAFEFIHPDDAAMATDTFGRAVRDPDYSPLVEVRLRHRDGSYRHFEGIGRSYLDSSLIGGVVVSFRDVTDRKRVEEDLRKSEEMHRALVRISPDAVTVTDLEGRITYVSPKTLLLHAYRKEEELLGASAFQLIAPEDHARAMENLRLTLREGSVKNVEYAFLRRDGSRFIAELNAALIRDAQGEPQSLVAFTRDITERKRMEKELQDRNEELEAFAHTISHDLMTPVAIVEGYAKAALEADAQGRAEAERECLEAIARGARRMSDLIDSLLQYAQAGHLDAELFGVDSREVLGEVLLDLEGDIRAKGAETAIDEDLPAVKADPVKLRQVFFNLVANALKHMGEHPGPRIEIGATAQGGMATFHVRDNGIGIPAELQKSIFEPFKHYSLAGSPGLGIGLSTVKRAVRAWGGDTWVESKPGEGATFFFTAPLAD